MDFLYVNEGCKRRFFLCFTNKLVLSCVGFGLGACLFACIAIFGIVASESYPAHLSGTAHAIVALAANGKYFY